MIRDIALRGRPRSRPVHRESSKSRQPRGHSVACIGVVFNRGSSPAGIAGAGGAAIRSIRVVLSRRHRPQYRAPASGACPVGDASRRQRRAAPSRGGGAAWRREAVAGLSSSSRSPERADAVVRFSRVLNPGVDPRRWIDSVSVAASATRSARSAIGTRSVSRSSRIASSKPYATTDARFVAVGYPTAGLFGIRGMEQPGGRVSRSESSRRRLFVRSSTESSSSSCKSDRR